MTSADGFNVGAFVHGPPTSPRLLVRHAELLHAYAGGTMAERDETREAYLSHYVFGPELQAHFAAHGSVAGFAGPCRCRWLHLDIDRPDLADALADARRLVLYIAERYGTDPAVWFSGSKGFHIAIELAHAPPPSVAFPDVARAFAEGLASGAGVPIDTAIYNRNHILRLPNTRHPKSGLFKVAIDADDLPRLSADAIRSLALRPRPSDLPPWRGNAERLAADWREAEAATARLIEGRAAIRREHGAEQAPRAPRYLLDFLRFGVPEGERHGTLFRCAAWLAEQGAPPALAHALLTEPGRDVGLPPKDVERQIRCGIEHALRRSATGGEGGLP